jgi:hypothetical protein
MLHPSRQCLSQKRLFFYAIVPGKKKVSVNLEW